MNRRGGGNMQCKIEGCNHRTGALNGLCLECEAKVWGMAHRKASSTGGKIFV